ncbi:MAG TPA: Nudix family hydrolase [Gammaproteobacteria bacterium]
MTNLIHVAVAVIRNPAGQVFITLRPEHVHQGGLWEFPGGKVEKGESVFEALRREIHEENAIDIQRARPLIKIPFRYPDKQVLLDVWEVLEFSGTAHGREGQACRWVNAGELSQIAFPAANKAIITAVQLPAVYLITPEPGANTQDFLQQLESRLASGITLLQLRAKHLESDHYIHLANEVVELCHRYHASVLLNHDPAVLAKVPADGIHLTARRLMQLEGRPIAESLWLAASCHSMGEIEQANRMGVDFMVLSPVNPTQSHPYLAALGWSTFGAWTEHAAMPVYALGGMMLSDITTSREHGGQGVAGIGAWWGEHRPAVK